MAWCVCTPWVFECVCWQEITVRGGEMAGFSRPGKKLKILGPKNRRHATHATSCDTTGSSDRIRLVDAATVQCGSPEAEALRLRSCSSLFSSLSCREILKAWKEVLKRAILIKDHQRHNYNILTILITLKSWAVKLSIIPFYVGVSGFVSIHAHKQD